MIESVTRKNLAHFLIPSISSGILFFLCFPSFEFPFLAWFCLIPLFFAIRNVTPKTAFWLGGISGTLYFLGTISWVTNTMVQYGKLPWVLSVLLMFLLVFYLSLYVATFSFLAHWASTSKNIPLFISAPLFWTMLEYGRGHFFTGFPWVLLGYSQYQSLWVIQIADTTSVYGISFLIVLVNVFFYEWVCFFFLRKENKSGKTIPWASSAFTLIALLITLFYGHSKISQTEEKKSFINLALIQGNIGQDIKWDRRFQEETLNTYLTLTERETQKGIDLVVWPEAATPFLFNQNLEYQKRILQFAHAQSTPLLFGSPSLTLLENSAPVLLNSAYLISPEGQIKSRYDKMHLVPFGEYVPLSSLLSFVNKMVEGIGNFIPGKTPLVMDLPKAKFGVVICFEVIFPELVRKFVNHGAQMMTTITNDAWFGYSSAPYQHFSMVVFRAIENRVSFARAANTGISGFIDSRGRILKKTNLFERTTLRETLFLNHEKTFYTQFGDIFAWVCVIMSFSIIIPSIYLEIKKKGKLHVGRNPGKI
ncbi:MAG TPA: apolipoprotein N-acyltransferase [Nitrospiria bacterium]